MCVGKLLYLCGATSICVGVLVYMWSHAGLLYDMLLGVLNRAARDAPRHMSVEQMCVDIYCVCVILHTTHTRLYMQRSRPHLANAFNILFFCICVTWSMYPFAWVWVEFAPGTKIKPAMCPRTAVYTAVYSYICVLVLLYM